MTRERNNIFMKCGHACVFEGNNTGRRKRRSLVLHGWHITMSSARKKYNKIKSEEGQQDKESKTDRMARNINKKIKYERHEDNYNVERNI